MKNIGEKIAFLRKEKGMIQSQLAEKMNVTDKAVSKWERNLSCPDINTISKLADILEVSVEELLQAKRKENANTKIKDIADLILKAVAIAMGIGVVVLNIMNQIDTKSSFIMIGIAIICISLFLLENKED